MSLKYKIAATAVAVTVALTSGVLGFLIGRHRPTYNISIVREPYAESSEILDILSHLEAIDEKDY